jgi:hypothetical protein
MDSCHSDESNVIIMMEPIEVVLGSKVYLFGRDLHGMTKLGSIVVTTFLTSATKLGRT